LHRLGPFAQGTIRHKNSVISAQKREWRFELLSHIGAVKVCDIAKQMPDHSSNDTVPLCSHIANPKAFTA
jgi:hypothetical protein